MSDKPPHTPLALPSTVLTLTLPTPCDDGLLPEPVTATLLIQRGDLAHVRQFAYAGVDDVRTAIQDALSALMAVEAAPPVVPELPAATAKPNTAPKAKAKPASKPPVAEEPTIDIPLKKGTQAVKMSHLKIVGGETDAAAYRQAVHIAGRLIDGKLWDGVSPIRIQDVSATLKKMKHLKDKDFSLFTLADFVQAGAAADEAPHEVGAPAANGSSNATPL